MSFTITIHDVADKDLGTLIASLRLPKGARYNLTHALDVQISGADPNILINGKKRKKAKERKSRRGKPDTKLTMTGKKASSGSKIEKGIELFEKFEAQLGIGDVSARDFTNHLEANGSDAGMLNRLITEGFLNYL